MGENLDVPGRMAVRTPMQWDDRELAGFSVTSDPRNLARPLVTGAYAANRGVNVSDQRRDADSLLSFVRDLTQRYRECPELGWGAATLLDTPVAGVLAHRSDWEGGTLLLVHHLADADVDVEIVLEGVDGEAELVDLVDGAKRTPVGEDGHVHLQLEPYDHRWYRVLRPGDRHLL